MKSRRASRRSSFEVRRLNAASDAASSQRRRVGRKTMAGSKLYEPRAVSKAAGGISGMRNFIWFRKLQSATDTHGCTTDKFFHICENLRSSVAVFIRFVEHLLHAGFRNAYLCR